MFRFKIIIFAIVVLGVSVLHFCTESPTDVSTSASATTQFKLESSTGVIDTVIVDSTEKKIDLLLTYVLGYFIDSVYINIYSGPDFTAGVEPDTQLVIRFGGRDLRDTTRLTISFATEGKRRFELITYKRYGLFSTATATAFIVGPASETDNTPPRFIAETPKSVYRFSDGEKVRFAVAAFDPDGDPLAYEFRYENLPLPRAESAVLNGGYFEWQSAPGETGIYPIIFVVSDGKAATSQKSTIVIGDVVFNEAPDIISEAPATARVGVLYDYQPIVVDDSGTTFSWELLGILPAGMRFDSLVGRILWIPDAGVVTSGPLTLKVTDFGFPQKSDSQRIVITVEGVNRPPVALSRSIATEQDVPVTVALSAIDLDDAVLTYSIVRQPLHGAAVIGNGNKLTYTPAAGFKGIDTVWWIARDALQPSDTVMVKIFVAMENQKPVAQGKQITTSEDIAVALVLSADDIEADGLTYAVLKNPGHGTLSGTTNERIYSPHPDFYGSDTFTFIANDGFLDSDPATVIIAVAPVNDTPRIADMGIPTALNTPVIIALAVTDPDDSVFLFELTQAPSHGTLDSSALPNVRYTPADGFKGADTLAYRAIDEQGCSGNSAHIVILVASDNARPVAQPQEVSGMEDAPIALTLTGSDAENTPLTYAVVTQPKHGMLSGSGATRTYTPYRDYFGIDTIHFTASDGMLVSVPAVIAITVLPVNDNPLAQSQSVAANLNAPVTILLSATDVDDTVLHFTIARQPVNGILDTSALGLARLVYTPNNNFKGNDTIRFTAGDASGGASAVALVTISVAAVNQRPVANPQTITLNEDVTQPIFLTGSDVETSAANLIFTITAHPHYGQLEGTLPTINYKTAPNFNGADTFWFAVSDGNLASEPARVVVNVLPVNDPPVATPLSVNTALNAPVAVQLQANDVDDLVLTYEVTQNPRNGTVATGQMGSGRITYTPAAGFKGFDTLWYRAVDRALLASAAVRIVVGVALDNVPPVAISKTIVLNEDTPKEDSLTGTDLEHAALLFTITKSPVHGRIENTLPKIRYVPNSNFYGTDSLQFTVSDGSATSAPATVRFTVNPINDAPVGIQRSISTGLNASVSVTLTGSDVEGGLLSFHISRLPRNGTLDTSAIGSARITYTPNFVFKGLDTLLFVVDDAAGARSAPTPLIIGVAMDNQAPYAFAQQVSTSEDVPLPVVLNAVDLEGNALTYVINANPKRGTLGGSGSNYTYTPGNNFFGNDTFEFYASDGQLNSNIAQVSITINSVNDPPAVNSIPAQTVIRGGSFSTVLLDNYVSDPDNTDQQIAWKATVPAGSHLVVSISSQRIATITVNDPAWVGAETVTFTATDPGALARSVDVVFTVRSNALPVISAVEDVAINEGVTVGPITFTIDDTETPASALTVTAASDNLSLVPASAITLGGTAASRTIRIVPAAGKWGSATISLTVFDGLSSVTEPFVLTVNGRPAANAQPVSVAQNATVAIILTGTDPETGALTYAAANPAHGTLTGTAPNVTYTPTTGYAGADAFTFTVTDTKGFASLPATVSITVVSQPPVAVLTSDVTSGAAPLAVAFSATGSSDPESDPLTYSWNFGDGNTGTGSTVSHTYATVGSFTAALTVTDTHGGSDVATVSITTEQANRAPTAVAGGIPASGDAPLAVSFNSTGTVDPDGDVLTYAWDFGDGSSGTGSTSSHTYSTAGSFTATLTVTDTHGASDDATVSITTEQANRAPTAVAGGSPASGDAPLAVSFNSTGTVDPDGDVLTYAWDFGDGSSGTGSTSSHTYSTAGSFTATLTVTDTHGASDDATVSITTTQANRAPTAVAGASPTSGNAPLAVSFNSTGTVDPDGDVLTYAWDFGDGSSGTGSTSSHTYSTAGSFTATLTVTDTHGAGDDATVSITVDPNPAPTADAGADQSVTDTDASGDEEVTLHGTASDDGSIVSSVWTEGESEIATGLSPSPVLFSIGSHTVKLTVTDNGGKTAADEVVIEVVAP